MGERENNMMIVKKASHHLKLHSWSFSNFSYDFTPRQARTGFRNSPKDINPSISVVSCSFKYPAENNKRRMLEPRLGWSCSTRNFQKYFNLIKPRSFHNFLRYFSVKLCKNSSPCSRQFCVFFLSSCFLCFYHALSGLTNYFCMPE